MQPARARLHAPRSDSRLEPGSERPAAPGSREPAARVEDSIHVALGVPRDADPSDDHLLDEGAYVLSYNAERKVPNWVAWRLDASYLGHVKRRDDFRPDPLLPSGFYRVSERDYRRSGFDRGHLCPSADREDSLADNSSTFVFTNIVPQVHELNAGPWEELEKFERDRARAPGAALYIVAGGVFREPCARIGGGVAVPVATFKIIAVLRDGETAGDLSLDRELYALQMPNDRSVAGHDMREFVTSVDQIEAATGYDFLDRVPVAVQGALERRVSQLP
ncbi:MAG TPA: DNA/RNA non-specific endonuclease [Polyangiaceae bacterium]